MFFRSCRSSCCVRVAWQWRSAQVLVQHLPLHQHSDVLPAASRTGPVTITTYKQLRHRSQLCCLALKALGMRWAGLVVQGKGVLGAVPAW